MKKYGMKIIFILLVSLVFLVGCSKENKVNKNIDNGQKVGPEVCNETESSVVDWIGKYTFSESVKPNINMFYSIKIYRTNGAFYADIYIDGFQRLERVKANVDGNNELIEISFLKYLPDNLMEIYKKDDILLTLEKKDSDIYTSWNVIQPILSKNEKLGIYFVKEKE